VGTFNGTGGLTGEVLGVATIFLCEAEKSLDGTLV